jgi:hypothetical protein
MSHLSVQTKLETIPSNLRYHARKQVQILSLLTMNIFVVLWFSNKDSLVIFYFHQYLYMKLFIYFFSKPFFSFRATFCFTNPNKGKVKISLLRAVEAHRVARGRGSRIT